MEDVIEYCNGAVHNQVMSDKEVEVQQGEDCLVTLLKKVSNEEVILHLIFSNSWGAYRIGSCPLSLSSVVIICLHVQTTSPKSLGY